MHDFIKVFECRNMPDAVRRKFNEMINRSSPGCYVNWRPLAPTFEDDDGSTQPNPEHCEVDAWLLASGAELGEHVLINDWL